MGGENAFDAVEGARGHGDVLGRNAVGGQRCSRELGKLSRDRRIPVQHGRAPLAPLRPAMGSRAGSGLPVDRSRAPGGTVIPRSERGVVAGRSRTRVPRRPAVSTAPRSRSRR